MLVGVGRAPVARSRRPATTWSPYYRIDTSHQAGGPTTALVRQRHPAPGDLAGRRSRRQPTFYDQVYRWFPDRTFDDVLIVGAGSGTDVARRARPRARSTSTRSRSTRRSSRSASRDHPDRPYDDPRVTRHVDDGRAFLRRSTERLRPRHLRAAGLADARQHDREHPPRVVPVHRARRSRRSATTCADDGVFVLYNYYREPWLVAKIDAMLADTFGAAPLVRLYRRRRRGDVSPPARRSTPLAGGPPPGDSCRRDRPRAAPQPATDDWPFLYLLEPSIAAVTTSSRSG